MDEPNEMGADITAEHMLPPHEEPSDVKKFYENTHIFITGGTGFMGNLLIQKLMRSCPEIKKIYILVRTKKGKYPEDRFDDIFKDPVFERMIIENSSFYEKIQLINGNCEKPNLGLNDDDTKLLIDKVNVVFHLASTRFEENIKKAIRINVAATKDLIYLSKRMQNLKALVYLSTVYSHCAQTDIDEQFYFVPTSADKLIETTNSLNDEEITALTPKLLGDWPNIFTFTKAVTEKYIQENADTLPIAIIRPSMVVSTNRDPLSGWTNNYYGPVGMVMAAALGLMRSYQAVPDYRLDMVPADYVVNCAIVSAWQIGKQFYNDTNNEVISKSVFKDLKVENAVPIFNYVCSLESPITWEEFMSLVETNGFKFPALLVIWYYCFTLNPNYYIHQLYILLLHNVPAYVIDTILYFIGQRPMMVKAYKKLHYFQNFFTYFSMRQWNFKNHNTQAMWKKLNPTDQRLFHFSMKEFYWNEYCFTFIRGARVYLLKESMDTLPKAQKRYRKMKYAHYFLIGLFMYLFWNIISFFLL